MLLDTAMQIAAIWGEIESIDPQMSTARLTAMTVEVANREIGRGFDSADIAEAMIKVEQAAEIRRDESRRAGDET